ncbi:MAG: spinster family MFS transporter [Janthinobacterium lividum]
MATQTADIAPPAAAETYSRGYRAWMLVMLMAINALNLADRQGMAAIAPALKADLGLSDTQLGLIQGFGFAILYTLLGLPIARFAERSSRVRIIAGAVTVFAVFVAGCSQARSFVQFLFCRVGVGIGDAGFGPPVASLLGDYYPARRRASAMTIVWLGAPIGAMLGSVGGGWVAQNIDWRAWCIGLAVPAIIVSLLGFFTLRDPPRGMSDPVGTMPRSLPSIRATMRFLLAKKSMRHVVVGCGLAAMGMNGIGQFFARYVVAVFHVGMAQAGQILGLIVVIGMTLGLAIGGFGVDWAQKYDRRWSVWGPAVGLLLAAPLFLIGINQPVMGIALPIIALGHIALFVYYTPTLALAQNMVGSSMRASSSFVIAFVLGLVGLGLGPTVIGFLSDVFANRAFGLGDFRTACPGGIAPAGSVATLAAACRSASASGITAAISTTSLLFVGASINYFLAARYVRQDLDTHYTE